MTSNDQMVLKSSSLEAKIESGSLVYVCTGPRNPWTNENDSMGRQISKTLPKIEYETCRNLSKLKSVF